MEDSNKEQLTDVHQGNGITQLTIGGFGNSWTISKEGWVRATMMRPSGGFEMRPMVQVYTIGKEAHAKLWSLVDGLDLEELKKLDSKDYNIVLDITLTKGRVAIKLSNETFDSLEPLVTLRNEIDAIRKKQQW